MSMVSIVIATYNGEKYVEEQIESILKSTYQDFKIYIYDDGSKDDTINILKRYESQYPEKIHVTQNETNLGVTMNFVKGFCRTTTDYIMFCDQDDVWQPEKIAISLKRLRHMEAQTGKDMPMAVFTDAVVVDQKLNPIFASFFQSGHLDPKKTDLSHLLMENKLIGCTVMVNGALRKMIQSHRLPKDIRLHDWWIALTAAAFGRISYVNERTLLYRQHGSNVVGNTGFINYVTNRITNLKKQKEAILSLQKQAEEFNQIYGDLLPEEKRDIIQQFADLHKVGFIKRRALILRYGYLKTGILRNIGLMIIA